MDRSGAEYACVQGWGLFDGPVDEASILAMKSWTHVTAVRIPLNEACWNAESYVNPAYAGSNYITAVKNFVGLAPVMAKVPVIVGEMGENDCGGSYLDSLTSWLNSADTSYLAWTWDAWGSCPSVLITGYAGDATPYGAAYQAILRALP